MNETDFMFPIESDVVVSNESSYLIQNYSNNDTLYSANFNACHYLLVDAIQPPEVTVPLYGYAMPVLLLVTLTANTFVVAVLSKNNMRSPCNTILLAISLSDLCTLLFPAPVFFYLYTLGNHAIPIFPPAACYTYVFMADILPNLFHTASIWLTLALALQRYIYICRSPAARLICSQRTVVYMILGIFAVAIIHQLPRFFEYEYIEHSIEHMGVEYPACLGCYQQWLLDFGLNVYYPLYFWSRVIGVHLLPCALLLLLNGLLYNALRQAQKTRRRLLKENNKSESKKIRDTNSTTMMLIVIVSMFIITEVPLAVITFLHILTHSGIVHVISPEDYTTVQKFLIVSNFFIMVFYPFNFAIYCGMSRQFRETFTSMFMKRFSSVGASREDSSRFSTVNGHKTSETIL